MVRKRYFLMRYSNTTNSFGEQYDNSYPMASSLNKEKLEKRLAQQVEYELYTISGYNMYKNVIGRLIVQQNDYAVFMVVYFGDNSVETTTIALSITYAYE